MMRKTRLLTIAAIVTLLPILGSVSCGSSPTQPTPPVIEPPPPDPEPEPEPDPPTLTVTRFLAFGDSLTEGASDGLPLAPWGYGLSSHFEKATTYPSKLQAIFDEIYTDQTITVTNAGQGGEKINEVALERLLDEIDDHNPQVLLLMHGVNNLIGGVNDQSGNPAISDHDIVTDAADWLDELIEKAHERKPSMRIFVATIPRQNPDAPGSKTRAAHLVEAYNDEVRKLVAEEAADTSGKVSLVNIYNVITTDMLTLDGLHITEAGNEKMAETFYAKIKAEFHQEPATIR